MSNEEKQAVALTQYMPDQFVRDTHLDRGDVTWAYITNDNDAIFNVNGRVFYLHEHEYEFVETGDLD